MRTLTLISLLTLVGLRLAAAPMPRPSLASADLMRFPKGNYEVTFSVEVHGKAGQVRKDRIVLKQNGLDKALVQIQSSDKERTVLMKEGRLWTYLPNLKRSAEMYLSQPLFGQISMGDILPTQWSDDYESKIERSSPKELVLFLTAKKRNRTYDHIRLYVDKATSQPRRAEFLSLLRQPLKVAHYQKFENRNGEVFPGEIRFQDPHRPDEYSIVTLQSVSQKSFPDSLFSLSAPPNALLP